MNFYLNQPSKWSLLVDGFVIAFVSVLTVGLLSYLYPSTSMSDIGIFLLAWSIPAGTVAFSMAFTHRGAVMINNRWLTFNKQDEAHEDLERCWIIILVTIGIVSAFVFTTRQIDVSTLTVYSTWLWSFLTIGSPIMAFVWRPR